MLLAPLVHMTRGVQLSVNGGHFQVAKLFGTVKIVIPTEKFTVSLPELSEPTVVKSAPPIGKRVVDVV